MWCGTLSVFHTTLLLSKLLFLCLLPIHPSYKYVRNARHVFCIDCTWFQKGKQEKIFILKQFEVFCAANETEDLGMLPHCPKDHSIRSSHPMALNSYSNYIVCYTLGMCCDFNKKQCM